MTIISRFDEDYIRDHTNQIIMWKLRSKNRRAKSEDRETDRIAAEIMRLAQGTPIVGYHDEDGHLVIPEEYDDGY